MTHREWEYGIATGNKAGTTIMTLMYRYTITTTTNINNSNVYI